MCIAMTVLKYLRLICLRSTNDCMLLFQSQPSKPLIMTNPAISALANDLKNSAQQYQQQQAGKLASLLDSQPHTAECNYLKP